MQSGVFIMFTGNYSIMFLQYNKAFRAGFFLIYRISGIYKTFILL